MKRTTKITESTGNVFADLGVASPEEALAKAALAYRIAAVIAERRLTQAGAAKLLGVDQPKVSALLRGKLAGFSTGRLIRFLTALGSSVEIVVGAPSAATTRGHLRVVSRTEPLVVQPKDPRAPPLGKVQLRGVRHRGRSETSMLAEDRQRR